MALLEHRLEDALLMLKSGNDQLSEFYRKVEIVFDAQNVLIDIKRNTYPKPTGSADRRQWIAFTVCIRQVPIIAKEDAVILGQAIQCFRNCLDFLAWALVRKHCKRRLNSIAQRGVAFPMAISRKKYWRKIGTWLPDVPLSAQIVIERYQPYRHSLEGRTIAHLQKLSNVGKHKLIVPTPIWPDAANINIESPDSENEFIHAIRHYKVGNQMKVGTKLITVVLAGLDPHVDVNTTFTILPMFPKSIAKPLPPDLATPAQRITKNISTACYNILAETANYL